MKSYRLFLRFNIQNQTNVLSFSPDCKNMVRKSLYHSFKQYHDTMLKLQQINFHEMNPQYQVNYACYILISIKLIAVLFYSEPNILPRKFYTQSSCRSTNQYHYINYSYKSHLHRYNNKEKLIKNDSKNEEYQSLAIVEI